MTGALESGFHSYLETLADAAEVKSKSTTMMIWVSVAEGKTMQQTVNEVLLHEQDENGAVFRDAKIVDWGRLWLILDYPEEHRS
jgi:hypothetical protein